MIELRSARAQAVKVTDDTLAVDLTDGRTILVPLVWFPRLSHAEVAERNNWHLIGDGEGIHWPDLDEDIGVESLIFGKPSGESQKSLENWLNGRNKPQQP